MLKQHPTAIWNPAKDYWETTEVDIFGHSAAYSATLPKSGSMRNGRLYERPTLAHHTTAPACSSLPGQVLPTPVAQPSGNSPEVHLRKKPGRVRVTDLSIIVENGLLETGGIPMLPTPQASDWKRDDYPADQRRKSPGITTVSFHFPNANEHTANPSDATTTHSGDHMPSLFDAGND